MRTRHEWWLVLTVAIGLIVSAAVANEDVTVIETPVEPPKTATFTGRIDDIHPPQRKLTVRAVVVSKTFTAAADCKIVTRDKPNAGFEDLKRGDEVDVTYQDQQGVLMAQRIVHHGVGPAAKEEARDRERLEDILTPSPTEQRND